MGMTMAASAQLCCNVVDGAGNRVVTTNGLCVIAPNLPSFSDCAPDSDGDGVADADDKCPNEAGLAANKGCPELNEDEKAVLKAALEGVHFETGKDVLTEDSKPKLHNVAEILKAHSGYKLKVSGYTDNTGDAALNLDLSKRRAEACKNYLVSDGISANRIMAEGYGAENPVADNSTAEGRAKNRRVEFTIVVD